MIDQDKAEAAINYLASTDEEFAALKSKHKAMDNLTKRVVALEFASMTEGAVESRKMAAYASDTYLAHINSLQSLGVELFTYENKRDRARITVEFWRSLNANRRQGNP